MERELPVYRIEGTDFVVDVQQLALREKANPANVISLRDMREVKDGYVFDYSPQQKNLPALWTPDSEYTTVKIPEFVRLDPVGVAEKYGYALPAVAGKSDFDLMVDQQALGMRLMGRLPTVDIAGHTFYVDLRMDMLRPKDDFMSEGIRFRQIDHYWNEANNEYAIPYHPRTHAFKELNYDTIKAVPTNLMVVAFRHESELDPVGWNRRMGVPETDGLKLTGIRLHHEARTVDWKETSLQQFIDRNLHQEQTRQERKPDTPKEKMEPKQRKGPRP